MPVPAGLVACWKDCWLLVLRLPGLCGGAGGWNPIGHCLIPYPSHLRKRKTPSSQTLRSPCSAAWMTLTSSLSRGSLTTCSPHGASTSERASQTASWGAPPSGSAAACGEKLKAEPATTCWLLLRSKPNTLDNACWLC